MCINTNDQLGTRRVRKTKTEEVLYWLSDATNDGREESCRAADRYCRPAGKLTLILICSGTRLPICMLL